MKENKITILSCGIGTSSIPVNFYEILKDCRILAGGKRLLSLFPDFKGEKVIIGADARESIKKLAEKKCPVVILASGDSLFYGIGKTVLDIVPKERIRIIPNVTAAQTLCSRLAVPWNQARFFSIHGKSNDLMPIKKILNEKLAIIYGDNRCNAAEIAKILIANNPEAENLEAAIGSELGMESEMVITGTLKTLAQEECSSLSVLAVINDNIKPRNSTETPKFGRPDSEYAHSNNMITHSEVRAVVLSKLNIQPGIMWDIGAGSGSVGIEAAGLCSELDVYSVEKDKNRISDINKNIEKFSVSNVVPVSGNALKKIEDLPDPDRIFIGGRGNDISEILKTSFDRLSAGGIIVATAVLLETRTELANTLKKHCTEIVSISISRSKELGDSRMMKSENNIDIFVYKK